MLLTVFGGSSHESRSAAQQSGSGPHSGSRVNLGMSTLDALDARVYAQQAHQLRNELEVSNIVNAVYNGAMDLVRAQSTAMLHITNVLRPPGMGGVTEAIRNLDDVVGAAQQRLQQSTTTTRNGTTVASTEQRQWGFQLYTSFLRALQAAWVCATCIARNRGVEKDLIENAWHAQATESSYGMFTINSQRDMAALVREVEQAVAGCIKDVDALRVKHLQKVKQVTLPLDLHIQLCKSLLAQVREWKEGVTHQPA